MKVIEKYSATYRTALIKQSAIDGRITVWFYFDGYKDYEWKRGSNGVPMDICDTLEQARSKAIRYIKKDYE